MRAAAILHTHTTAIAIFDEVPWQIHTVIAHDGSGLLFPAPDRALTKASELELHIPDESLSMQDLHAVAMVGMATHPGDGIDRMRWEAYHGEPPTECWMLGVVQAVRIRDEVLDIEELDLSNPLFAHQAILCATANTDPELLGQAVAHAGGMTPEQPRAVGVDRWGVHVRGAFGVHRIPFNTPATDAQTAQDQIHSALRRA